MFAGQKADHFCQLIHWCALDPFGKRDESQRDPRPRKLRVFLVFVAIDYSLDPVALFSVFSFAVKPVDAQASLENASYD